MMAIHKSICITSPFGASYQIEPDIEPAIEPAIELAIDLAIEPATEPAIEPVPWIIASTICCVT